MTPIAIVAADCEFAGASGREQLWRTVLSGTSCIGPLPEHVLDSELDIEVGACPHRLAGWLPERQYDLLALGLPPRVAQETDRSQLELLDVSCRMMRAAGYGPRDEFNRKRAGVFVGVAPHGPEMQRLGGYLETRIALHRLRNTAAWQALSRSQKEALEREMDTLASGQLGPAAAAGFTPSLAAGRLAKRLDMRGSTLTVANACASALVATIEACRALHYRDCDLALVGATDFSVTRLGMWTFARAGALSVTGCRPFDQRADGTLLGVGCGAMLLQRAEDAQASGRPVLGLITGWGVSADGRESAFTVPSKDGIKRMFGQVLESSGKALAEVQYVEAHATGTPRGDAVELEALAAIVQERGCPESGLTLGGNKQLFGHTRAASGMVSVLKVLEAFKAKTLPPFHIEQLRPPLGDSAELRVLAQPAPWEGPERRAVVTSYGFGGTNAGVLLEDVAYKREAAWG